MSRLLKDGRTYIYFDASFLMWLAKIGPTAREEFFAWQAGVDGARFHVPLWAAHEFFKHRLKKTVSAELVKEIRNFDSAATGLYEKLRVYCSDQLFGFKDSGHLFLDEYRRTVQPLRAMLKIAEGSDQFDAAVQDVATYIDAHLLPGPLHDIIEEIEVDERVRNRGTVPPSFKDAHKRGSKRMDANNEEQGAAGDNSFGDLALWREILKHASSVRAGATVLLTADRKNDWFENWHGDEGLTPAIRKRVLRPRPVPAPHPLLVREAFDRGAGTLSVLDPMYCGVLLEHSGTNYTNFAAAALDAHLPDPERKRAVVLGWARRFGASALLFGETLVSAEDCEKEPIPFDAGQLQVDQLMPGELSAAQADVIARLKDGDIGARTEAFSLLEMDVLENWDVPALVALGLTVARLAEANDPAATEWLAGLRDHMPEYPAYVGGPLYFGALGALYFNEELDSRPTSGSQAYAMILSLVTAPEMAAVASRLGEALAERPLFYRPGQTGRIVLSIVVQPAANNKSPADLLAIKFSGTNLITNLQTEEGLRFTALLGLPAGEADIKVGALLELIARFHLLPRQLIDVDVNVDTLVHVPEYAGVEIEV